jgi:PEP-CTERM motif/Protein of unknown function (DUF642)
MKAQMKIKRFGAAAITLLALIGVAQSAQATSIVNGNFETGPFGGTPAGFTVSPGNEIVAVQASAFVPCCNVIGSTAQLANHLAAFGGNNAANISTLSQILSTEEGGRYTISFDFAAIGQLGRTAGILVNAFDANTNALLGSFSTTRLVDNNLVTTFERFSFNFIGASSATRLSFNLDPAFDSENVDGVLDNVTAAVPEPATWAMMIAGFGFAGAALRRRRVNVVYA